MSISNIEAMIVDLSLIHLKSVVEKVAGNGVWMVLHRVCGLRRPNAYLHLS